MQFASFEWGGMHWREDGASDGFPLVFANSLGTDLRLWDKIVPLLPAGFRIIRFDKRGHGLSDLSASPFGMSELATDAADLLDRLGIKSCIFVGLSIGGMIGQMLASRRPDLVRGLVLSNSAAVMGDPELWRTRIAAIREGGLEEIADATMERWFSGAFRATDACSLWRNLLTRTPDTGYIACAEAIAASDLFESTAALRVPALGIAGREDGASPPEQVWDTVKLIPDAKFEVIETAGHLPCVEAPEEYARILNAFLDDVLNIRPEVAG